MKCSRFAFSTAAALVVMLVAGGSMAVAADGPKLVLPEKIKDMGTVAQGEILEIQFELVNEGDQPLEIRAVRPTCGCTVASSKKNRDSMVAAQFSGKCYGVEEGEGLSCRVTPTGSGLSCSRARMPAPPCSIAQRRGFTRLGPPSRSWSPRWPSRAASPAL